MAGDKGRSKRGLKGSSSSRAEGNDRRGTSSRGSYGRGDEGGRSERKQGLSYSNRQRFTSSYKYESTSDRKRGDYESYWGSSKADDDARITVQLRRLSKEDDAAVFSGQISVLLESINHKDNLDYIQHCCHYLFESLMNLLEKAPSQSCKVQVAEVMSLIGHLLIKGDKRYVDVICEGLEDMDVSNDTKILLLVSLKKGICMDKAKPQSIMYSVEVLECVRSVLENTDVSSVMVACVEIFRAVYSFKPDTLSSLFQDIIDILVGWHIDHELSSDVTYYVSKALRCFPKLWTANVSTAITLLSQFIEDTEDYLADIEASMSINDDDDEAEDPVVNTMKIEHLIGVYSTVLNCVPDGSLEKPFLLANINASIKAVETIISAGYYAAHSTALSTLHQISISMLKQFTVNEIHKELMTILTQSTTGRLSSKVAQLTYLELLNLLLKDHGSSLTEELIRVMFHHDSPLRVLRLAKNTAVWQAALSVDQAALALKNVPLLQDVYQYVLADLQLCYSALMEDGVETNQFFSNASSVMPGVSYSAPEATAMMLYYFTAMAPLCNTRSSIITMWALNPSLFQLLAGHLTPAHAYLATQYPNVQSSLLTLLHSHCRKHTNFVGSSDLIVDPSCSIFTTFNPNASSFDSSSNFAINSQDMEDDSSSPFGTSNKTAHNLSIILNVLQKLFDLGTQCSREVLQICLEWLQELCGCATGSRFDAALQPVIHALVQLAASLSCATLETHVCDTLYHVLISIPLTQIDGSIGWLKQLTEICWLKLSCVEEEKASGYLKVLCAIPLPLIADSVLSTARHLKSAVTERLDVSKLSSSLIHRLQQLYRFDKISSVHDSSLTAFHQLAQFLFDPSFSSGGKEWLRNICRLSHRLELVESNELKANKTKDFRLVAKLSDDHEMIMWQWLVWQMAKSCVDNKLKTTLGRAHDTFMMLELAIKLCKKEVLACGVTTDSTDDDLYTEDDDKTGSKSNASRSLFGVTSNKNEMGSFLSALRVTLLLNFLDSLEINILTAQYGCLIPSAGVSKAVRSFYQTNQDTCNEGLNRIRSCAVVVALNAGYPHVAARHAAVMLQSLTHESSIPDIISVTISYAQALTKLNDVEAILGLQRHIFLKFELSAPWLTAVAYTAANRHEDALRSLQQFLCSEEVLPYSSVPVPRVTSFSPLSPAMLDTLVFLESPPVLQEYIQQLVLDFYSQICDFDQVCSWISFVHQSNAAHNSFGFLNKYESSDYHKCAMALNHFDNGAYPSMQEPLQPAPDSEPVTIMHRHFVQWPLWNKLDHLQLSALRCITETVFKQGSVLNGASGIVELSQAGRQEVQKLLHLLSVADYQPELHLQLVLLNQLFQQTEESNSHSPTLPPLPVLEGWDSSPHRLLSVPSSFLPLLCRYTKMIAQFNTSIADALVSKLQISSIKQARKHCNYSLAQRALLPMLGGPLYCIEVKQFDRMIINSCAQEYIVAASSTAFTTLSAKLLTESAKLLYCGGMHDAGCQVLTAVVYQLYPTLLMLAQQDPSLLSLPPNETGHLSARALLNIAKWAPQCSDLHLSNWFLTLNDAYTSMKPYAPYAVTALESIISDKFLPPSESFMAQCIVLATSQAPTLAKSWFRLGSWCFKWGRVMLDEALRGNIPLLGVQECAAAERIIHELLSPKVSSDAVQGTLAHVLLTLNWLPAQQPHDSHSQDELNSLTLNETPQSLQHLQSELRSELSVHGLAGDSLEEAIAQLMSLRQESVQRHYELYSSAAQAYFKYFSTCTGEGYKHNASRTTAALRLVRLIVKHASHLRHVFEEALPQHSVAPWRAIIPQLFARLNHSEGWVRQSFSDLLCRVALESPQLIVVPAVVGASVGASATNTNITDMLAKYFHDKKDEEKREEQLEAQEEHTEVDEESDGGSGDEGSVGKTAIEEDDEEDSDRFNITQEDDDMEVELSEDCMKSEGVSSEVMHNCFNSLVNALNKQGTPGVSHAEVLVQELRRITVLWDELWLGSLTQHHSEMTKKMTQLKSEASRLEVNSSLTQEEKCHLIKTKHEIIFKPIMLLLEQLEAISSQPPETPHEQQFQQTYSTLIKEAMSAMRQPADYFQPQQSIDKLKTLLELLQHNKNCNRRSNIGLSMTDISPRLATMKGTNLAMPGILGSNGRIVKIASIENKVSILQSKTKPKKLSFIGDDGVKYTYLFKGLEDLHLDERIMQFLSMVNTMLSASKVTDGDARWYRAHHYTVVPLGPRSGLIQWVDNATSLFSLYMRWQCNNDSNKGSITKPSELYYQKLAPRLKAEGVNLNSRKLWPKRILGEVIKELIDETPSNLLSRELLVSSVSAPDYWRICRTYSISTAVMSMIGFVIGLGDRHLDNLLIRLTTGEVIHIDYNICFEKGKYLRVPESVPFRMTQNIENALGVTGVEGVFRYACEHVLSTMRDSKELLLTLLETFIYDPLVDWTHDADMGYTGAMYGGHNELASNARAKRQQLEKGLTVTMFKVRTKEMTASWNSNKELIETILEHILTSMDTLIGYIVSKKEVEDKIANLENQQVYLKAASADGNHPCHSLIQRHKDNTKANAKLNASTTTLQETLGSLNAKLQEDLDALNFIAPENLPIKLNEVEGRFNELKKLKSAEADLTDLSKTQRNLNDKLRLNQKDVKKVLAQIESNGKDLWPMVEKVGQYWQHMPNNMKDTHIIKLQSEALGSILDESSSPDVAEREYDEAKTRMNNQLMVTDRVISRIASQRSSITKQIETERQIQERLEESLTACLDETSKEEDVAAPRLLLVAFACQSLPPSRRSPANESSREVFYESQILSHVCERYSSESPEELCASMNQTLLRYTMIVNDIQSLQPQIVEAMASPKIMSLKGGSFKHEHLLIFLESLPYVFKSIENLHGRIISLYNDVNQLFTLSEKYTRIAGLQKIMLTLQSQKSTLHDDLNAVLYNTAHQVTTYAVNQSEWLLKDDPDTNFKTVDTIIDEEFTLKLLRIISNIPLFMSTLIALTDAGIHPESITEDVSLESVIVSQEKEEKEIIPALISGWSSCMSNFGDCSSIPDNLLSAAVLNVAQKILQVRIQLLEHSAKLQDQWEKYALACFTSADDESLQPQLEQFKALLQTVDVNCSQYFGVIENCETLCKAYVSSSEVLRQKMLESSAVNSKHKEFVLNEECYCSALLKQVTALKEQGEYFRNALHWYLARQPDTFEKESLERTFQKILTEHRRALTKASKQTKLSECEEQLILLLPPPDKSPTKKWLEQATTMVSASLQETKIKLDMMHHADTSSVEIEFIKKKVNELKEKFSVHHRLMSDVKDMLRKMMKFKCRTGEAVKQYVAEYRNFINNAADFITSLQKDDFMQKLEPLRSNVEHCYEKIEGVFSGLLELCSDYKEDEESYSGSQSRDERSLESDADHFNVQQLTASDGASNNAASSKLLAPNLSYIVTNKGVGVEHNPHALAIWQRVKQKLEGTDTIKAEDGKEVAPETVAEQVDRTIALARDLKNLSILYEGWTPWV